MKIILDIITCLFLYHWYKLNTLWKILKKQLELDTNNFAPLPRKTKIGTIYIVR